MAGSSLASAQKWPDFVTQLMDSAPGSIDRRFPKYWSDQEGGIDWGAPVGTPVIALADGQIVGAGYFCNKAKEWGLTSDAGACDHGVVTTRVTNQDGTQTDLYYQHIILNSSIVPCFNGAASCNGQFVKKGQVIGYISDFGMLEMGVNVGNSSGGPIASGAHWGGMWGADPSPGPHVDPEPYLRALISGQNTTGTIPGLGLSGSGGTLIGNLFPPATLAWIGDPVRIFKLIAGLALVFVGLVMLIAPQALPSAVKSVKSKIGSLGAS